jgi:plastocyanin
LALVLPVLSGCSSPLPKAVGPVRVAPNGQSTEIQSLDNTFRPAELTITAGTEIVFTNVGRNDHEIIPAPASPFQDWGISKATFGPKVKYKHVFDLPGTYAYVCKIHGVNGKGMVGTITVTEATGGS